MKWYLRKLHNRFLLRVVLVYDYTLASVACNLTNGIHNVLIVLLSGSTLHIRSFVGSCHPFGSWAPVCLYYRNQPTEECHLTILYFLAYKAMLQYLAIAVV